MNTTHGLTYDVVFNNDTQSSSKGFKTTDYSAKMYIETRNRTNVSYFKDYKGGTVSVVCNKTGETVFSTTVI